MYTPTNSHDPKTDHRSLFILIAVLMLSMVGLLALTMPRSKAATASEPYKYAEVDGCSVYRFDDEEGPNYFANCPTGNSAVTTAAGRHIPSFKADTIEL